jgi:hypothetical protein
MDLSGEDKIELGYFVSCLHLINEVKIFFNYDKARQAAAENTLQSGFGWVVVPIHETELKVII